ncbi:MAG: hypothetical protein RR367_11505, partial [Clostridia bacterium]
MQPGSGWMLSARMGLCKSIRTEKAREAKKRTKTKMAILGCDYLTQLTKEQLLKLCREKWQLIYRRVKADGNDHQNHDHQGF